VVKSRKSRAAHAPLGVGWDPFSALLAHRADMSGRICRLGSAPIDPAVDHMVASSVLGRRAVGAHDEREHQLAGTEFVPVGAHLRMLPARHASIVLLSEKQGTAASDTYLCDSPWVPAD